MWPWIAQLGQGRGGLCSYDWLENLLGCDVHSARRVLPQFQKPLPVGADVVVEPAGAGSSRLIVRSRATSPMARPQGPAQFVMQRRSMLGIKERAEGTSAPWTVVVLEPLLWLLATAVFVAGATMASGGSDRSGQLESRSRRSAWSTRQRSAGRRFLRASRWSAHPCSPWS